MRTVKFLHIHKQTHTKRQYLLFHFSSENSLALHFRPILIPNTHNLHPQSMYTAVISMDVSISNENSLLCLLCPPYHSDALLTYQSVTQMWKKTAKSIIIPQEICKNCFLFDENLPFSMLLPVQIFGIVLGERWQSHLSPAFQKFHNPTFSMQRMRQKKRLSIKFLLHIFNLNIWIYIWFTSICFPIVKFMWDILIFIYLFIYGQ